MFLAKSIARTQNNRCRSILKICDDINANARRWRNQGSGFMQNRKLARKWAGEASLPELLDRLELALTGMPARTSVCSALSDLNRRLGSASAKAATRTSRSVPPRRRRQAVAESLPLFS
jgi:hypothetical protein